MHIKYNVLSPDMDHVEKEVLFKGYWNPQKNEDSHTFFDILKLALKVNKNADISIFLIKGGGYFLRNFHRICLYMQKSKHIYKGKLLDNR